MSAQAEPATILVADDDPATLRLLTAYLVSDGHAVVTASSGREVMSRLSNHSFEVVLLDLMRSDEDRSRICRDIRASSRGESTPLIVSADAGTLAGRNELHNNGADDFVSKPYQRTELLLRIGSMLRIGSLSGKLREKTVELKSAKALLRKQATTDGVTGLFNKNRFEALLARVLARAERSGEPVTLLSLTVEGLRQLNRSQGHAAGDRLLQRIATVLREHLWEGCLTARWGSKRFALILPRASREEAGREAQSLVRRFRTLQVETGTRIGVAVISYPEDVPDDRTMLEALERAKESHVGLPSAPQGRPRISFISARS